MLGIKLGSAISKAITLPNVLSLQPQEIDSLGGVIPQK